MGILSHVHPTLFADESAGAEIDTAAASAEVIPRDDPMGLDQMAEMLNNGTPTPDLSKCDFEGMAGLRLKAFNEEDSSAAMTWAANLSELKKQCFDSSEVKPCQVLATESMHMAAKYYSLWDNAMMMQFGQDGDYQADVDAAALTGDADHAAAAEVAATATPEAPADVAEAAASATMDMSVAEAAMTPFVALLGAIGIGNMMQKKRDNNSFL